MENEKRDKLEKIAPESTDDIFIPLEGKAHHLDFSLGDTLNEILDQTVARDERSQRSTTSAIPLVTGGDLARKEKKSILEYFDPPLDFMSPPWKRGGMSAIYRTTLKEGFPTETLSEPELKIGKTVAVKSLRLDFRQSAKARAENEKHFLNEAAILMELDHPHIVKAYLLFRADDTWNILMDYIEGESLNVLFRERQLSPVEILIYVSQIADALWYVHKQKIFHRDIKPSNIVISKKGAYLMDFGIAKIQDSSPMASSGMQHTVSGVLLASKEYIAPERIHAFLYREKSADMAQQDIGMTEKNIPTQKRNIDARSDQFIMAILIFEGLTGNYPFDVTTSQFDYWHALLEASKFPEITLEHLAIHMVERKRMFENSEGNRRLSARRNLVSQLLEEIESIKKAAKKVLPEDALDKSQKYFDKVELIRQAVQPERIFESMSPTFRELLGQILVLEFARREINSLLQCMGHPDPNHRFSSMLQVKKFIHEIIGRMGVNPKVAGKMSADVPKTQ